MDNLVTREKVNLPNGMTCYQEFEQEALRIFEDAYDVTGITVRREEKD